MKEELISVIVPIYGVENYINRCINSIMNQTYKNIEIILVDDGGIDNCPKICDEYALKDNRIKVVHKENGGLSSARNAGIDASSGLYITTVDGDDYIEKDYIENLYKLILENDADISSINRTNLYENDANGICKKNEYLKIQTQLFLDSKEYKKYIMKDLVPHEAWAKLYKAELLKNEKYEYGLSGYEDLEFIFRLLDKKTNLKISIDLNKFSYIYRRRENSITSGKYNKYWDKEIKYYTELLNQEINKEFRSNIELWIFNKTIRNIKKIIETNENLDSLKYNLKELKKVKITSIKGKKNLIIFLLAKYNSKFYLSLLKNKDNKTKNKFDQYFNKVNKKQALLFNGPTTGNIGDHAILFAEEKYLEELGYDVLLIDAIEMNVFFKYKYENKVSKESEIFITGGGNTGSLWRNEQNRINKVLDVFKENKITIFPQTIYYTNDEFGEECLNIDKKIINKCKNLEFQCRDKKTYDFVKENFKVNATMKKDMALSLDYTNLNHNRSGLLLCFRNDLEKNITEELKNKVIQENLNKIKNKKVKKIDTVLTKKREYRYDSAKKEFDKIIKLFSSSELVITDRLHAMIISYITNTPCIAFDNLSKKVSGVYETLEDKKGIQVYGVGLNGKN